MKHTAVIAALLLSGCVSMDRTTPAGQVIKVRWLQLDTQLDVAKECAGTRSTRINGFAAPSARVNPFTQGCYRWDGDVCEIVSTRLQAAPGRAREVFNQIDGERMRTAGHELRHCYQGHYHNDD